MDNWVSCATCLDGDSDAYFDNCDAYTTRNGPDCDDGDPDNWVSCATCLDGDSDTYYLGCDDYITRNGPDCDDADINNWVSCATCLDGDSDGYHADCDDYVTINGPDCNDGDSSIHPGATEIECDFIDQDCSGTDMCIYGDTVYYVWTKAMGGNSSDGANQTAFSFDTENIYFVGGFRGTSVDFGVDFGTTDLKSSAGDDDVFITHFTYPETYQWTRVIGESTHDSGNGIAVDSSGNIYFCGSFEGNSIDFGEPFGTSDVKSSAGGVDAFLTKLSPGGTYQWTRRMGGTGDSEWGRKVAVDSSGSVYMVGMFQDTVDFGEDFGTSDIKSALGEHDIFVTKVNTDGSYGWTRRLGGTGEDPDDRGHDISANDQGDVFIVGYFRGTVNFADDFSGNDSKTASGQRDIFIIKINSDGSYGWTRKIGDSGWWDQAFAVAVDLMGNVYFSGTFEVTVDFAEDFGGNDVKSADDFDIFITKVTEGGTYLWTRTMGGTGIDLGKDVDVDVNGDVYMTGKFENTVNFAQDFSGTDNKTSNGSDDAFIMKIKSDGSYGWTKTFGGSESDSAQGIAVDGLGNIYATGQYKDTVDFAHDFPESDVKVSNGAGDAFIIKLSQ